jgi:flagellar hook assembly protein FlgD
MLRRLVPVLLLFTLPAVGEPIPIRGGGQVVLAFHNHTSFPVERMALTFGVSVPWLTVAPTTMPATVEPGKSGNLTLAILVGEGAKWGDRAEVEVGIAFRFPAEPFRTTRLSFAVEAGPRLAASEERASRLRAIDVHLVSARPGALHNRLRIAVDNPGKAPIRGFALFVTPSSGQVVPQASPISIPEEGGDPGIPAGGSRTYAVLFAVEETAKPGTTEVLSIRGRAGSRTDPAEYEAEVIVAVDEGGAGGNGNFEGFACYNLKPPPDGKPPSRPEDWLPVPKGTELKVAQVYEMPGPGGVHKPVEQFIGYGHVLDERGFFRLRVDPVGQPPYRLRLVAETIARDVRALPDAMKPERFEIGRAVAAVTPSGKRTWRVISPLFRADRAAGAKDAAGGIVPAQDRPGFVAGKSILLPYYGYARDIDPDHKADEGILIDWEGELTTGGHINFFQTAGYYTAFSEWRDGYAQEIADATDIPGLIWHNRPELLHILSHVVRAQGFAARFVPRPDPAKEPAAPPAFPVPPAIAFWKPGLSLAPGETGYWLRDDGVFRLEVSGAAVDPDEADGDLVARGYGGAVRYRLLERTGADAKPLPPAERRYRYDARTSPERAFALGFDTFFACAAAKKPVLENLHASDKLLVEDRKVDLDAILVKLRAAEDAGGPEALLKSDLRKLRGIDNAGAVAAGMWLAWKDIGDPFIAQLLAPPANDFEPRGMARFLDIAARQCPGLMRDFATLGLAPRVEMIPSPAVAGGKVAPSDVIVLIDVRGLTASEGAKARLAVGDGVSVPVRIDKGGATGTATPGSLAPDGRTPAFADGQTVSWQVFTEIGEDLLLPGPSGSFTASVPGVAVGPNGSDVPVADREGRRGNLSVAPGNFDAPKDLAVTPLAQDDPIDGKAVLGRTAYSVTDAKFPRGAKIRLPYDPDELPPGSPPPSVHRRDAATGEWENLGGEEVEPGLIEAEIDHASLFALLLDPDPPSPEDSFDGPDPFDPDIEGTFTVRFALPSASEVTFTITDPEGRVVARPAERQRMSAGKATLSWDGRLENGEAAPDGVYGTTIRARDPAGREGPPASGRLTVFRGVPAAVHGDARAEAARVTVRSEHGSARTLADEDGSFALYGLAPGEETLVYSARGFFPEERPVRLEEGAEVGLPEVALTNRALLSVTADPPVIRPGAGGDEPEELSLRLVFDRACEARVEVLDRTGRAVRVLLDGPVPAGEQGLSWTGDDDRGRPREGRHTVRVTALAGGERVLQGEARVLVDRGLVTFARAVPRILSPDGDGFDDAAAVTLSLADDARVSVTVTDSAGAVVREIACDEEIPAGWFARDWDGRDAGGSVLPEGVYRVLVEASYLTGERSRPASAEAVLDLSPPRFLSIEPENGVTLPSGRPTIRARIERVGDLDPSSLMVKIDEYSVPPDDFDPATGWLTYTPKTSLGEGVHIALVYARDLAENMAMPEATSFTVKAGEPDRTRPRAEFASPVEGATVYTARPSVEALLRDDGAGIDPESIRLSFDGEEVPNRVRKMIPGRTGKAWDMWFYDVAVILFDPLGGRVRYNPMKPLAAGRHVVRLMASDRRGNSLTPIEQTFTVVPDDAAPRVTLLAPARGYRSFVERLVAMARAVDEGGSGLDEGSWGFFLDGEPLSGAPAATPAGVTLPFAASDGAEHLLTVSVRDRAGNAGFATTTFSVAVDREPPVFEGIEDGIAVVAGESFEVRGRLVDARSGLDPASVRLLLDGRPLPGAEVTGESFTGPVPGLPPAGHRLTLVAEDRSGNSLRREIAVQVRSTTTPPEILVVAPEAAPAAGATPVVEASLTGRGSQVDPASIRVRLDGRLVPVPPGGYDEASGRLRFMLPDPAEKGVQHVLTIDASDRDGNESTASCEFTAE